MMDKNRRIIRVDWSPSQNKDQLEQKKLKKLRLASCLSC